MVKLIWFLLKFNEKKKKKKKKLKPVVAKLLFPKICSFSIPRLACLFPYVKTSVYICVNIAALFAFTN